MHPNKMVEVETIPNVVNFCKENIELKHKALDFELERVQENKIIVDLFHEKQNAFSHLKKSIRRIVREIFADFENKYNATIQQH